MRRRLKIFKILLTVLLILQVSVAFALPPGAHLKLCFGSDGHFDISPNLCAVDSLMQQISQLSISVSSKIPHSDCLDVLVEAVSVDEFRLPVDETRSSKANIKRSLSPLAAANLILSLSPLNSQIPTLVAYSVNSTRLLPSHLVSTRTTVLLV